MNLISQTSKKRSPVEAFALFLLALGAIGAGVYIVHDRRASTQLAETNNEWSLVARSISSGDHLIGDASAPIHVIAYSSISCPSCRVFFERQVPKLQAAFGDRIVIAYRHNPIPSLPNAAIQEEASECVYLAGGNEAFWRFVRLLFPVARESYAASPPFLADIARKAGVSPDSFTDCLATGAGEERVRLDKQEAAVGGLTVDPSFLVKSEHRAVIVKGLFYSQVYAGVEYLLEAEREIEARQ